MRRRVSTDAVIFRPPACKSGLQRALLLAFLSEGETVLALPSDEPLAEDPGIVLNIVKTLGAAVSQEQGTVRVQGSGWPRTPCERLFLGMNGTALRCLTAFVGCLGGSVYFRGARALRRRSIEPLPELLMARGAAFTFAKEPGSVPFHLQAPTPVAPLDFEVDASRSSQPATGLLMALAGSKYGGRVVVRGPLGYLPMTCAWLAKFGCEVECDSSAGATTYSVPAAELRAGGAVSIPGDPSALAWALAAAAARRDEGEIPTDDSLGHPDHAMLDHLRALGLRVRTSDSGVAVSGEPNGGDYAPLPLDDHPDSFPPLVSLLTTIPGRHRLGSTKLRGKESDRIAVLGRGLARFGFDVTEEADVLAFTGVHPGSLSVEPGMRLDPKGDHRMAMALALIAKLHNLEVRVRDTSCVAKSWPGFWGWLAQLDPQAG